MIPPRTLTRHALAVRRAAVVRRVRLAPTVVRLTLGGAGLAGFDAPGPDDHVKLFLPDPATGVLHAPTLVGGALQRSPDGVSISRDYTARARRGDGPTTEVDVDVVLHGTGTDPATGGPASVFAATAAEGTEVVVAGPRGSRDVPAGVSRVVLVADETALPAAARWCEQLPAGVVVTAILDLEDESVDAYVDTPGPDGGPSAFARASVERLYRVDGPGQVLEAVRSLGRPDDDEIVWAAGEATALVPVRRYLRRELGLPAEQAIVDGYWKRGVVNRDHHEPLDPSDPD
ncbi:siderophore-interacting protein [Luteimicrobium subarcticum]|uniref:NADPH-dependent ferric siderophore reductase n=1 Tax=Luteimicrobium subarcticum TaxID=620910 RepID=A0A2M8WVD4_9MICO|nr:siderophore-interacting protein [Luteimicrobium subarcticum]PJI94884.1 NADPH-dependent ferric siderophore reductase [Luteimicrobium subarcticum]